MPQDLKSSRVGLLTLMQAGGWGRSRMPARYADREVAEKGELARYYQGKGFEIQLFPFRDLFFLSTGATSRLQHGE